MENNNDEIKQNKKLNLFEALIPLIALVILLSCNVIVFGDDTLSGSNQMALLLGGAIAFIVGIFNKVRYDAMINKVALNIKSISEALLILFLVGALAGTWLLSGVIPAMIYYGLMILKPAIFLPATVIICAIISLSTGSSWTTSATVGIGLVGIGQSMGINPAIAAGAVISGAYFGDKMSPLSDTTNLAAAIAGSELIEHIRYMMLTTIPSISIALIIFAIIGFTADVSGAADPKSIQELILSTFTISPMLFIVPVFVIYMIIKKTKPTVALLLGALLGGVFALIFQPEAVMTASGESHYTILSAYKGVMNAMTVDVSFDTGNPDMNDLFSSGGMSGMMNTVWLCICAMVFGGIMEAIGALARISDSLLKLAKSTFGLVASTVGSCVTLNVTASDQYMAIVVGGKMFEKAYRDRELAPENLSRTLEDAGTVTSVLVPWNTCGAYQSSVLGVSVSDYFIYAIFNYISPFMTLIYAWFGIKIKKLVK